MRRDPNPPAGPHPYDLEAADDADITQQFWGTTRGWSLRSAGSGEHPTVDAGDREMWADRTGPIRAIRVGLADLKPRRGDPAWLRTGTIERTRAHGIPRPDSGASAQLGNEATLGELARGDAAMELMWDDDGTPPTMQTARISRSQPAVVDPERAARRNAAIRRTSTSTSTSRGEPRRHGQALTASDARTRSHDAVRHDGRLERHPDLELELDEDVADDAMAWRSPVAPLVERLGLGAVDPLLLRLGMMILIGVLALPFALASRDGGADAGTLALSDVASSSAVLPLGTSGSAPVTAPAAPLAVETAPVASDAPAAADAPASGSTGSVSEDAGEPESAVSASGAELADAAQTIATATDTPVTAAAPEVAVVDEPAERVEPDCSLTYEAGPGDSWYRIAEGAGITPQAVLTANGAGLDTVIFPGDEICLPQGATMPTPPTTAAPTTAAPATTSPASTSPATTQATATTAAPTTAAPPAPVSTAEVQRLIREIWPDDLEERALQIAWRESNYRAGAWNGGCCYGVFQLHWTSHRGWLDDYGITSTNDLLDARKNITAAFALYQRAGGWGPWGG